jgi:hypoxanthine phosphoribosyltransferase
MAPAGKQDDFYPDAAGLPTQPSRPVRFRTALNEPLMEEASAPRPRRRGSRGGRRHRRKEPTDQPPSEPAPVDTTPEVREPAEETGEKRPARRRGSRGGRRHRKTAPEAQPVEPAPEASAPPKKTRSRRKAEPAAAAPAPAAKPSRRRTRKPEPPSAYDDVAPALVQPTPAVARPRTRIPVTGAPTEHVPAPFAHNAEYEFARILDFYGIDWRYEPRSFPLRWERGHVTEAFTPDFFLPDLNMYVELTTLKTGLTAEKNRKMRTLKELYPDTNIIMLKKRDYLRLLAKYGYGAVAPNQVTDIDRVLMTAAKIQQRVSELGAQISQDYAGKEPVLVGVLRGVLPFIADLMRHITLQTSVDLMSISSYDGNGAAAVRILKDLDENIKGRDVILIEDIVDTGMTLNHIIEYLQTKRPASIKVCTLLDKRARRIVNVPLEYVGFEIADEFVVGYGLDFAQRFRNLPFIGTLKHDLLP